MTLNIQQDDRRETVTVEGITYSQELFRDLARALPLGQPFTIESRQHGVLTVRRLAAGGNLPAEVQQLLRIWQSHLGESRGQCDDAGRKLWDRIEAAIAGNS